MTAINARPTDAMPYSYRLNALHYLPHFDPALIFHEHADWNQKHSQPLNYEVRPHDVDRNPKRRLRIGFVSAEFREHPIGIFMEGLLPGGWPEIMARNRDLALAARELLCRALRIEAPCPAECIGSLAAVPLQVLADGDEICCVCP